MSKFMYLPADVMCTLGAALLAEHGALLDSTPLTAGMVPVLKGAQREIQAVIGSSQAEGKLAELTDACVEKERRHDLALRCVMGALESNILWARFEGRSAREEELMQVQARLLPEGGAHLLKPWHEEASQPPLLLAGLSPRQVEVLASVGLGDVTALALCRAWVQVAEELGGLLQRRGEVEGVVAAEASMSPARIAWHRAFSTLLTVLPLSGLSAEAQGLITGPLLDAVAKAERRAAERARGGESPVSTL